MRLLALLLCLGLLIPALAEPAARPRTKGTTVQTPGNNPRPRASTPVYAHTPYVFGGQVSALTMKEVTVEGKDKGGQPKSMRFRLSDGQQFPEGLAVGDRVAMQYTTTLDSGVYQVVRCRVLPEKEALPESTFPKS